MKLNVVHVEAETKSGNVRQKFDNCLKPIIVEKMP